MLGLAACSDDSRSVTSVDGPGTSSTLAGVTTTATSPSTTTTTGPGLVGISADFSRAVIELDGVPRNVAVADTNEERARGLMGVEQVSPLDGMLFVFDDESVRSFWMKDTLIPLDIAFFDADGLLVTRTSMSTCPDGDCPGYSSVGPAQYALEAPAGTLADLREGARLVLIEALEGSGKEI